MDINELNRIFKRIFFPFLTIAIPILWVLLVQGYIRDTASGHTEYNNKGEIGFMLLMTAL
jgi:hypothetical protein